jgi:hypothetical protein
MYIVGTSTSVFAIPTKSLIGNAIVYLSSTSDTGQLVSVFDIDGYLSSPNSIIISTTSDTIIGSNVSSIKLQQKFAYATLRSESATQWTLVDENAFPQDSLSYSVNSLQATTISSKVGLYLLSTLSTTSLKAKRLLIQSSASIIAPLFTSSIVVDNYAAYISGTNYPYFQTNSASNMNSFTAQSTLSVGKTATFLGSLSTAGPLLISRNMSIFGGYDTLKPITIYSTLSTNQRILVDSNLTVVRQGFFGSNIVCQGNFYPSSLIGGQVQTSNLSASFLGFPSGYVQTLNSSNVAIQSAFYVSSSLLQTSTFNTNDLLSPNMTVTSSVNASGIPILSIPTANIQNPGGSLTLSSLVTGSLQVGRLYGTNYTSTINSFSTGSSQFSTMIVQNYIQASTFLSTQTLITEFCRTNLLNVSSIQLNGNLPLQLNSFSMSSLQVFNDFSANQMSSFTTYSTLFDATGATFSTAKFTTSGSITTSSFQVLKTVEATNSLNFNTPVVSVSTAIIQSLSTQSANTSSLYTVGASVGVPLNPVPNAPYMYGSTVSGLFPDTASEFITGQGTPYFPLRVVVSRSHG